MWQFDYSAHSAFVAPAAARAELWRTIVGLLLITGIMIGFGPVIYSIVGRVTMALAGDQDVAAVMAILFGFGAMSLGAIVVLYFLHDRTVWTLFGAGTTGAQPFGQFLSVSIGIVILLAVVAILPPWGYGEPLIANRAVGAWLALLPFAILGVFIQSSAEEILFRGYLQQQLAARFHSPIVWMVVPSILFALAHYDPQGAGDNAWIVVAWAALFGLAMADITARAGTLGPAIAVHFINNLMALLIVAMPDELGAAALYVLPFGLSDTEQLRAWMPVDFATTFVMWLVARLMIRR